MMFNSVKLKMFSNSVSFETCTVLQQEDRGVYCTMPNSHLCYGLHGLNVCRGYDAADRATPYACASGMMLQIQ